MTAIPSILETGGRLADSHAERLDAASSDVEVVRGDAARGLLHDGDFLRRWDALLARCPWGTGFQSHRFANVWYSTYEREFEPVLLIANGPRRELQGLLTLAIDAANPRDLIVAGRIQAEYHTWICEPSLARDFPLKAMRAVRRRFPRASLTLRYVPSGAPLDWLEDAEAARLCLLEPHRRPLMRLGDGKSIAASLKKGSNRSKWKRLEKLGGFEFRQVTEPAEFERVFDDIVRLYDFRHGAIHGSQPFCTLDKQKKFHVAMLRAPELLHVTTMTAGGRLAAAHFGVRSGRELQLGVIVHDPALAKHSPGKLHLLALGKLLVEQGFETFDLTPGGDTYKERFANDADQVYALTLHPTPTQRRVAAVNRAMRNAGKSVLRKFNLSTGEARHHLRELRNPVALARRGLTRWARRPRPAGLFERVGCDAAWRNAAPLVRRDALDDLLAYRPTLPRPSRQKFLSATLAKLEAGERAYTFADAAGLAYVAWMAEPTESTATMTELTVCFDPGGKRKCELPLDEFMRQVFCQAAPRDDARLSLVAGDDAVARAAERIGFRRASAGAVEKGSMDGTGQDV